LDLIHAYLRMRLDTRPEKPSIMSIRQVIYFLTIMAYKGMFYKTIEYKEKKLLLFIILIIYKQTKSYHYIFDFKLV